MFFSNLPRKQYKGNDHFIKKGLFICHCFRTSLVEFEILLTLFVLFFINLPHTSLAKYMSDDIEFTVNQKEIDSEFADIQRQVASLQEDLQLKQAQEQAARDEGGPRKSSSGIVASGPKNSSVFLAGLDPRVSDSELRLFFSQCGPIRRITILKDRFTGQPRGNAYVEFESDEAVHAAVLKNGQAIHGKPIKIDIKREAPPGSVPPARGGGPMMGGRGGGPQGGMMMGGGMPMMPNGMPMMGMMPAMGGGGYAPRGGRGGPGGVPPAAAAAAAAAQMQQQMAMAAMMGMMSGAMQFNPYGAQPGGRGGRGRGRGRPY
jgi:polyadenylate-binding protein 2